METKGVDAPRPPTFAKPHKVAIRSHLVQSRQPSTVNNNDASVNISTLAEGAAGMKGKSGLKEYLVHRAQQRKAASSKHKDIERDLLVKSALLAYQHGINIIPLTPSISTGSSKDTVVADQSHHKHKEGCATMSKGSKYSTDTSKTLYLLQNYLSLPDFRYTIILTCIIVIS